MELDKHIGNLVNIISSETNPFRFGIQGTFFRECDGRYGIIIGPGQYFFFKVEQIKEFVELGGTFHFFL